MKTISKILLVSISLVLSGCPPYETTQTETPNQDTVQIEQELAKTSTGQDSINYLNSLRQSGNEVALVYLNTSELVARNGHSGGGYDRAGNKITIFINSEMGLVEKAHVFAHELVHVKDDFDIEAMMNSRSDIKSQVENFMKNYKTQGVNSFSSNVSGYVLNTLFCTESRAYTKNAMLSQQGYPTQLIDTKNIGTNINQKYIIKTFNITYGSNAEAMYDWCMKFNSMSQIQQHLVW